MGRVPFDQNFRKLRFKIEWKRNFPEIHFENFGSPLEVVLFSGNLEIPEISCSIWHFYPVWIGPSSFSREKLQDGRDSFESTLPSLDAKWSAIVRACSWSKTKTLGSDENRGLVVPNFLWVSSPGLHTLPREKFVSFSHKYQERVEFWVRVLLRFVILSLDPYRL